MNDKVFVVFAKKDLEKVCQECKDNKYCLKFENDLIRCNLIDPTHFKNLRKSFSKTRTTLEIPNLVELNIGHSIISRAVFVGLEQAVKEMKALCEGVKND